MQVMFRECAHAVQQSRAKLSYTCHHGELQPDGTPLG